MSDAFVTSLNLVCHSYHRIKDLFQSPLLIHSLLLFFLRIIQYILLQKKSFYKLWFFLFLLYLYRYNSLEYITQCKWLTTQRDKQKITLQMEVCHSSPQQPTIYQLASFVREILFKYFVCLLSSYENLNNNFRRKKLKQ